MKMLMTTVAVVFALTAAVPALANGGGSTAGAMAGASAGASANVGSTNKSYALGGSVGAAECANAFNLLGIGASMSDKGCGLVKSAIGGYQAGLTTLAEARAIYFAGVAKMGVVFKKNVPQSASTSASSGAKAERPNYTGEWKALAHSQQKEVVACTASWNKQVAQGCQ